MKTKSILKTPQTLAFMILALFLAMGSRVGAQTLLFSDNFARAYSTNVDASLTGVGGYIITNENVGLGSQANLSPWFASDDFSTFDANDSNVQVLGTSPGTVKMGGLGHSVNLIPNFNFATLVATGEVIIQLGMTNPAPPSGGATGASGYDRYIGIGVGFSLNGAMSGYSSEAAPAGGDRWMQYTNDLFVEETANGYVNIYDNSLTARANSGANFSYSSQFTPVFTNGILEVDLFVTNTAPGSTCHYNVLFNGTNLVTGRSFTWSTASSGQLCCGMEERAANGVTNASFTVTAAPGYQAPPGAALTWRAQVNNKWDTSTANWASSSGSSTAFYSGASVQFNDNANNTTVNIPGTVMPGNMSFANVNSNYVFSGAGSIGGTNIITLSGAGICTLDTANSYSGGIILNSGTLQIGNNSALGTGPLTQSGGELSSANTTAYNIANNVIFSGNGAVGDTNNTGTLTLADTVNFNGGTTTLTINSPVVFPNGMTNGALSQKTGPGTLTVEGTVVQTGSEDVQNGALIYNGATVAASDRVIPDVGAGGATATGIADLVITNGASVLQTNVTGNLRAGRTASAGTNYLDLAGVYSLPNATPANGGGACTLQGNAVYSQITFWPGGDYATFWVTNSGGEGNTVFNFNGGILRARMSTPYFFSGLTSAYIQSGGAFIDTTNYNVTIAEGLTAGTPSGGLTKFGTGTLTLTGADTYTGPTVISNGTVEVSANSFLGGGTISVGTNSTANLMVDITGSPMLVPSLSAGSVYTNSLTFDLSNGVPAGSPMIEVTNFVVNGPLQIDIAGSALISGIYPLILYTNLTGSGSLSSVVLGSLPPGSSAVLIKSGNTISVNLSYSLKNLEWSGAVNGNWDTSTKNWYDLNHGNNPTNYAQSGGIGDFVTFDDNGGANPNVNITTTVTPSQLVFNNNTTTYVFSGSGGISGSVGMTMNGSGQVTMGTVNSYTGGTVQNAGQLYVGANNALGTGPVTLNAGELASEGSSPETVANMVTIAATNGVVFGDSLDTGTLTFTGGVNLDNIVDNVLDLNCNVIIAGMMTNGGLAMLPGPGTLIVSGQVNESAQVTQTGGNVLINGGQLVTTGNGWRLEASGTTSSLDFAITNGGSFIMTNLSTGNFKLGLAGDNTGASYQLDIAGTMDIFASGAANGNVYIGYDSTANAVMNLWAGGHLTCDAIASGGTNYSEVDFYGGTLTPTRATTTFFQGVTNAYVQTGGLTVDTTNLNITIAQPLLAGTPGGGGLTKLGTGTLTLTGASTYTGPTLVNAGELVIGAADTATGGITVAANSTLAYSQTLGVTGAVTSVTIGSGANSALEADLVTSGPVEVITNLILNGSVAVNASGALNVGDNPLFGYGTISGPGGLTVGVVPQGFVAHISTNVPNKTIDLVVTSITPTIWTGAINGNWDLATTNWTLSGVPVAYVQNANVWFNDTASITNVTLTTNLAPNAMIVSNNTLSYAMSGSGVLSGGMSFTKYGTNSLTLSTADTYTGPTTIAAGEVFLGNSTALGSTNSTVTVLSGATVDLQGNAPGLQPFIITGTGLNGQGALANNSGQLNALRNVTMSGNATISGNTQLGIRMPADTDPGFNGNGYNLTVIGTNGIVLNGGETAVTNTKVWDPNVANIAVQQGLLSIERRMTFGTPPGTITVSAGAGFGVFSLNTNVLPVQTKPIHLEDATLSSDNGTLGDFNQIGSPVSVDAGSNSITTTVAGGLHSSWFLLEGPISGAGSVYYSGTNQLFGTNTYTGSTVVTKGLLQLLGNGSISNTASITLQTNTVFDVSQVTSPWVLGAGQTLGGIGTVNGSVQAKGTLSPGNGIGTLNIAGNLTIAGNLNFRVNTSLAQSNDVASVSGTLSNTGTGTLTVTNLGPTLVVGQKFTLFSRLVSGGNTLTVTGGGATWNNNLSGDGSITVATVTQTVSTNAVTMTNVFTATGVTLSWPVDHIGWRLQVQTNSLATGIGTSWATWPGSSTTNLENIPLVLTNQEVFFRLVYP